MSMIQISAVFTRRISMALSSASASCPAMVENKKKGSIKSPAAKLVVKLVALSDCPAAVVTTITKSAFLNRLSFSNSHSHILLDILKHNVRLKYYYDIYL